MTEVSRTGFKPNSPGHAQWQLPCATTGIAFKLSHEVIPRPNADNASAHGADFLAAQYPIIAAHWGIAG